MAHQATSQIYRQEALEHHSAPEQFDHLLRIVTLKSWVPLAVVGGGILAVLVWSLIGRIPVTVEGTGLLLYPQQIISFQAPASGQLTDFAIRVGDQVEAGQELGRINQPELLQRLAQERVRLEQLITRDRELHQLWSERASLEREWTDRTRKQLTQRIAALRVSAKTHQEKSKTYFAEQVENLAQLIALTETLAKNARDRYEHFQELAASGMATDMEVADAQRFFFDNQTKLADVGLRKHALELQKLESDSGFQRQLDLIAELELQVEELDVEFAKSRLAQQEAASARQLEIQESRSKIERLSRELEAKGLIVARHTGRVLEITAAVGQIVSAGQRLGAVECAKPEGKLRAIAYYRVADGKKISPAMSTCISPGNVQRERHGSILGKIISVSSFPVTTLAVTNTVGNAELAHRLTSGGNKIEVIALLEADPQSPTGFRWTSGSGPASQVSAGTTVAVRTTIESRRPISYVLPILRTWSESGD